MINLIPCSRQKSRKTYPGWPHVPIKPLQGSTPPGFELRSPEKQMQVVVRAGLEPGTAGLRVRHADHSATLPPDNT